MGSYPVVMIHQVLANVSLSLLSGQVARDRYPLCFQAAKHPLHRRIIPAVASAAHALAHAVAPQSLAELTATRCTEYPYGAVIADSEGHICAAAMGKTKEGLAELIRLKLLHPQEGYGEDPA